MIAYSRRRGGWGGGGGGWRDRSLGHRLVGWGRRGCRRMGRVREVVKWGLMAVEGRC